MKDETGEIIYIGKAKNLKKRVRSYFDKKDHDPKTKILVSKIHSISYITTKNETEAFVLENNMIKNHQPRYNIQLKDNKTYPFIAIDMNETFPRIYRTRENHRKGVKYYGPYTKAAVADFLVKIGQKYFKTRVCKVKISLNEKQKPCLYYHIGKCPGYCIGKVSEEDYSTSLKRFTQLLNGRFFSLIQDLKQEMEEYSKNLDFEKAAEIRDLIGAVNQLKEKQKVYLNTEKDIDVFGYYEDKNKVYFSVLLFREGRLISRRIFKTEDSLLEINDLFVEILSRYYEENPLPEKIYSSFQIEEDNQEIIDFLEMFKNNKTQIVYPVSGIGLSLIRMASRSAKEEFMIDEKLTLKDLSLIRLKEILGLSKEPRRIEGYDIATIEGKWSVGSCVSFFNGKPDKNRYRNFKIKWVEGQNDYAMLREVLLRRFSKEKDSFPDLIMIDGGKGQLNACLSILDEMEIEIPLISLAKKEELIFQPYRKDPIRLDITDPSLKILMDLRDEAHRFANRLHHKIRKKPLTTTVLESISGIGPKKRQKLLKKYGSPENIKKTSAEEIKNLIGISLEKAEELLKNLEKIEKKTALL